MYQSNDSDLYFNYTVLSGDTIYTISDMYGVPVHILYAINGIKDGDYLYPNQQLLIPKNSFSFYLTKDGDTLNTIFNEVGFSYEKIINGNLNVFLMPDQLIVYKRD